MLFRAREELAHQPFALLPGLGPVSSSPNEGLVPVQVRRQIPPSHVRDFELHAGPPELVAVHVVRELVRRRTEVELRLLRRPGGEADEEGRGTQRFTGLGLVGMRVRVAEQLADRVPLDLGHQLPEPRLHPPLRIP
jgi:hypothetical protein